MREPDEIRATQMASEAVGNGGVQILGAEAEAVADSRH